MTKDKAIKDDEEKIDISQVPQAYILAASRAFMFGEKKYGRNNWKKGFEWHRLYAALMRHLWAWWEGEEKDPESTLSHLDHACACLAMLKEHEDKKLGKDTRFKINKTPKE